MDKRARYTAVLVTLVISTIAMTVSATVIDNSVLAALFAMVLTLSLVWMERLVFDKEGEVVRIGGIDELRQVVTNADTTFVDEAIASNDPGKLALALKRVKALLEVLLSLAKTKGEKA